MKISEWVSNSAHHMTLKMRNQVQVIMRRLETQETSWGIKSQSRFLCGGSPLRITASIMWTWRQTALRARLLSWGRSLHSIFPTVLPLPPCHQHSLPRTYLIAPRSRAQEARDPRECSAASATMATWMRISSSPPAPAPAPWVSSTGKGIYKGDSEVDNDQTKL